MRPRTAVIATWIGSTVVYLFVAPTAFGQPAADPVRRAQHQEKSGLTDADVRLYIKVRRATIARAKNPTPTDLADRRAMARISAAAEAAQAAQDAGNVAAAMKAAGKAGGDQQALLRSTMPLEFRVAEEMHINVDHYQAISEVIDDHVSPIEGPGGDAEWKHDEKVIAPYRKELEALFQEYLMAVLLGGAQKPDTT